MSPSPLLGLLSGSAPPAGLTEADWQQLVREATRHGLAPLLYHRLESASLVAQASSPAKVGQRVPPASPSAGAVPASGIGHLASGIAPPAVVPESVGNSHSAICVPHSVRSSLRESFLKNAARNALLYHDLAQVLTTLQTVGIKVAVLKGAHLAALIYSHIGLRCMADIDLLVPEHQLELTHTLLLALGYTPRSSTALPACEVAQASLPASARASGAGVPPATVEQRVPPVPSPVSGIRHPPLAPRPSLPLDKHLPCYDKPPHPRIEIHWTIADPRLPLNIDPAAIHSRLQPAIIAGVPTHVLAPEDFLLYQCTHLAGHRFSCHGLRPLCDLSATLQHHHELDWSVIQGRAREWQAQPHVYLALRLAAELLATPFPPGFLDALRPADFDNQYYDFARESVFHPASEPSASETESNFARVGVLADGVTDTSLAGKLRFLLRTAFPTREHMTTYMAQYYSLPLTGQRRCTCYLTRLLDLSLHGLRLFRHAITHRKEAALRLAQLKREAQLWRWLTSGPAKGKGGKL